MRLLACFFLYSLFLMPSIAAGQWQVGVARVDITPVEPLRLSGYSNRVQSHTAVADPLHVRVVCLTYAGEAPTDEAPKPLVLVSIDSIAVTSSMTSKVAESLKASHAIPRSHLVLSSTHSHTAPHLPASIDNLFREPSTAEQVKASQRYLDQVIAAIHEAIETALNNPISGVQLEIGESSAHFAVQRRLVRDGRWTNFGVQEGGQVDHRVHVLRMTTADGRLLGAVYQYACHCTTLGPDFNQISGDWAGLSANRLEELNPGSLFLPVIGCGADANPEPRTSYEAAIQHSLQMVDAVSRVLKEKELEPLPRPSNVQFGMVGLEPEQPTQTQLKEAAASNDPNESRWAKRMQQTRLAMGRLPESVPLPIHVWTFGDALSWVFLGGEVVVDYQFTIEKELPTGKTWVAAYCDDVPGYVASEAQRPEGGYEVDYSMIFYLQPGRWKSGTQSNILTRVREISQQERGEDEPLDPQAALKSMIVPEGYRVDLVASEPLIQDPVNIAFGWDGRIWVAQMSDYPLGKEGGGCVRLLTDTDGDGIPDQATTFLEGLNYPTSVHPWRKGVLVIAAPNVIFAEDTDGDSVADQQQILLSGIAEVNPQHRASGFEIGLDGRLHFAIGDGTRELVSHVNGQTYRVQGHDVIWNPDTGEIELFTSGTTQFVPGRDAFGNWFGNHNNQPMFQFVGEVRQLGGSSLDIGNVHHLLTPAEAPPVFPRSRTVDRFNDLYTRDRYTSACGSMIVRTNGLQSANVSSSSSYPVALICEPVHNLVARIRLRPDGSVFSADRHPEDSQYDFFASTDPWSRPVRAVNAPDGSVWILDMYRQVIEHPQWIPVAWQSKVDIRAGEGMGRIYRVYHHECEPGILTETKHHRPRSLDLSRHHPMALLQSPNGAIRDMTTQAIITDQISGDSAEQLEDSIRDLLPHVRSAEVTSSLLGVLAGKKWLQQNDLTRVLQTTQDPQLIGWVLKLASRFETLEDTLKEAVQSLPSRDLGSAVDLQWVLNSRRWDNLVAIDGLTAVLARGQPDRWLSAALALVDSQPLARPVVKVMLSAADESGHSSGQLQNQLPTVRRLLQLVPREELGDLLEERFAGDSAVQWKSGDILLLAGLNALSAGNLAGSETSHPSEMTKRYHSWLDQAVGALMSSEQPQQVRDRLSLLLGSQTLSSEEESKSLRQLMAQGEPGGSLALQRLRYAADDDLGKTVVSAWEQLSHQARTLAAGGLMARPAWRDALVAGLESGTILQNQLPPAVVQSLTGHYDRNLRSRAIAVFGRPSPRQTVVSDYLARMPNPLTHGNSERGQQWYREHCAACHTGQDGRTAIAPPIDNLTHWNNEQWVTAVLDPSQAVEERYKQSVILTVDQEVVSGIVLEETSAQIKVAINDGSIRQIAAEDIEDRKQSSVSLMPDGFEARISPEQLADIIHYFRNR